MPLRHVTAAALLVSLAACGGGGGSGSQASGNEFMRPGEDCLGCHREFTAAGTVYASANGTQGVAGVAVTIYGQTPAQDVHLTTNSAGNFFTTASFGYGSWATVRVGGTGMATALTSRSIAACNSCHGASNRVH